MAKKITTSQATRYLTRKSRGGVVSGRNIVYTPELIDYISQRPRQSQLRNVLVARAASVVTKGVPKKPKGLSNLARLEYKAIKEKYEIEKFKLAQYLTEFEETGGEFYKTNVAFARRLASVENLKASLQSLSSSTLETYSYGRIAGILSNTIEWNIQKTSEADVQELVISAQKLFGRLTEFEKAYEVLVSAHVGSEQLVQAIQNIGENAQKILESAGATITSSDKENAEKIVAVLSKYNIL